MNKPNTKFTVKYAGIFPIYIDDLYSSPEPLRHSAEAYFYEIQSVILGELNKAFKKNNVPVSAVFDADGDIEFNMFGVKFSIEDFKLSRSARGYDKETSEWKLYVAMGGRDDILAKSIEEATAEFTKLRNKEIINEVNDIMKDVNDD